MFKLIYVDGVKHILSYDKTGIADYLHHAE